MSALLLVKGGLLHGIFRNRIRSQFIYKYLDDQVCNGIHSSLQCRRNADPKNRFKRNSIKADFPKLKLKQRVFFHKKNRYQR